jgi:hypothetical protein
MENFSTRFFLRELCPFQVDHGSEVETNRVSHSTMSPPLSSFISPQLMQLLSLLFLLPWPGAENIKREMRRRRGHLAAARDS